MKELMNCIFRKRMGKYWPISGILAGVTICALFAPLTSAAHTSLKIKYKSPLAKEGLLNIDRNPSTVAFSESSSGLQNFIGCKQDLKTAVNKIDEITQKLSSVGTILDTILSNDPIRNVQSCQCPVAKNQASNTKDYKSAVRKVYNNQIDNFDSVLNFADSVKFDVFKTIYNEMKANGHTDIRKLLQLSESLQKGISDSSSDELVAKTQSFISTLWNESQEAAIGPISDAFLNNSLWSMVKQLTATVNSSCIYCVDNIYTKVVENLLDEVNATDILKQAKTNLKCLDECVSIHQAIFNKLDSNSNSYSDTVISLARHIKATMDDPDYKTIHPDKQTQHDEIKNKLPLSLRNAIFSASICIKNTKYNEYFFASGWLAVSSTFKKVSSSVSEDTLRFVFTWVPGDRDPDRLKFKWRLYFLDDNKFILIDGAFNEYLYSSSAISTFDPNGRIPNTKILRNGTVTDPSGFWSFQVNGDNIYIKNGYQNEFLYAHTERAPYNADVRRRWVLTYIPGGPTSGSTWEIVDCTDFH